MEDTVTLTIEAVVESPGRVFFDSLRRRLTGSLLTHDEPGYDALVSPWNLAVPMRPAAVVAARTAQDVVETVRFAGAHGLTAGVQATGHGAERSLAGHILVLTRDLDEVTVHPEGWARVGAGVKWSTLVAAAAPYGLAGVNGSTTDVGIVGYTTGGGVGPMARTYGINADRVRAFEVVTGDGVFRRVTPTEYPDLFFALRGGKGAAGIVTAIEFDLIHMPTF
jgi:FAD/FMN-containing dehydrogenase